MRMPTFILIILSDVVFLHPETSIQSIRTESNKAGEMQKLENRKEEGWMRAVTWLFWTKASEWLTWTSSESDENSDLDEFPQTSVKPWEIPHGQKWLRNIRWLAGDPADVHAGSYTRFGLAFAERVSPWALACTISVKTTFPLLWNYTSSFPNAV